MASSTRLAITEVREFVTALGIDVTLVAEELDQDIDVDGVPYRVRVADVIEVDRDGTPELIEVRTRESTGSAQPAEEPS
jgi:hypothetical protein